METNSRRQFITTGLGTAALWALGATQALAWTKPTVPQVLGPYHRKGAPWKTRLVEAGEPGQALQIRGRVLDTNGKPLKGAVVDVWQADDHGHYDNDDDNHPPDPDHFHLRGQMRTDANGNYAFDSILPGLYEMSPGVMRPRHIHYIVSCPGFVPVTTQLYFEGDPWIAQDPFARPSLVIKLQKAGAGLAGVFDIVLAKPAN
ncbi:MAG: hypothetical protein JWM80_1169 [Cyanobacteria bacterium RYN_339]|nr:hypothetical protein [Cyanobacteria bacterium RYN_339]